MDNVDKIGKELHILPLKLERNCDIYFSCMRCQRTSDSLNHTTHSCYPVLMQSCQVVIGALDIIIGLTGSPEGIEQLKIKLEKLLVFSLRLVPVTDPEPHALQASEKTLTALVNLAQDRVAVAKMHGMHVIGRLMDYMREKSCPHFRLMVRGK